MKEVSLIKWLNEHYREWKFVNRYPDVITDEFEDISIGEPSILEARSFEGVPNLISVGDIGIVYFIDGAETRDVFASAEPKNEARNSAYPIAIGQTSVVACKLDVNTESFVSVGGAHRNRIVISLPFDILEEETEIDWTPIQRTKATVLPYKTDGNCFKLSKRAIHTKMREDEERALYYCLGELRKEQSNNALIIIDGQFPKSFYPPEGCPVLSIDKSYNYPGLSPDIRSQIGSLKNHVDYKTSPVLIDESEKQKKTVWYVRLRDYDRFIDKSVLTAEAGIVECALLGDYTHFPNIIEKCTRLLRDRLANPTCYGMDKRRWRMHLYHMYLTETLCKSFFLNQSYLFRRVYGQ